MIQYLADRLRPLPPVGELVNVFEFEEVAKRVLAPEVYATIAGSDRSAFDRMTLRPRMLIPMLDLDLSVELFGDTHFTPIIVGPVAEQRRYHADHELATVAGAGAAKAAVVISDRASASMREIAAQAKTPLWYAVYANRGGNARKQIDQAVAAGCKAVCITVDRTDWKAVDQLRAGLDVAVVIKGVMTVADAKAAVGHGARGVIVSNHARGPAPIDALPAIAGAVGGKATILIDGDFRRGPDIIKALILGAQGVLVARPVMWALAGYGAEGVQALLELMQTDLARHMGALGAANLKSLTRDHLRIHRR